VGLALAGTIFYDTLSRRLPSDFGHASTINYSGIKFLQPELKAEVVHAVSSSIRMIWTVYAPCLGVTFLISWLLRKMPNSDSVESVKAHTTPQSADQETV